VINNNAADDIDQYAKEIGYLVLAWNRFQENIGMIFGYLIDHDAALKMWYTIRNDRSQRDLLRSLLSSLGKHPTLGAELEWILKHADSLGSQRDDVVHSSLVRSGDRHVPFHYSGNPRAKNLAKRNLPLLSEYIRIREDICALSDYTVSVLDYWFWSPAVRREIEPPPKRPILQGA